MSLREDAGMSNKKYSKRGISIIVVIVLLIVILIGVSCWLLVSEIPMFSLKFKNLTWADNKVRFIFLFGCLLLLACFEIVGIALIIVWFIILSLITQRKVS